MLSRHRASSFRTAVGVVLGLVLGTLALIQMPALARTSVMPDEPVTILLEAASVREAIARMADFAAVEVVNLDRVDPTLLVSSRATRVPASTVFESLLFCSGHRYVEIEAGIELVTTMTFGGSYSCRISEAGQVEVSADSITAYDEGSADRL